MSLSILLPKARLLACSENLDSLNIVQSLNDDWRFARVEIETFDGCVDALIEGLKKATSPDIILIEASQINDKFKSKLEELAAHCSEDIIAIVAGAQNDVQLYRGLIDMGVSDYIVTPFDVQSLSDILAKSVIDKMGVGQSRLIGVIGAKGGVGASSMAQSLAWGISQIAGEKTALLDGAGGHSVFSVDVGFEPAASLMEACAAAAAKDDEALSRMFFSPRENLNILASGREAVLSQDAAPNDFEWLLDWMLLQHPYVVVDLSSAPNSLVQVAIARADDICCVTTPFLSSLRFVRSIINEIQDIRGGNVDGLNLILNQVGVAKNQEVMLGDIEKAVGVGVSASMPFAPEIFMACEGSEKQIIDSEAGRKLVSNNLLPLIIESYEGNIEDKSTIANFMRTIGLGA